MNTGRFACAGCANIRKVIAMYVVPEAAGRGVGKSLLQALIAQARKTAGLEQLLLTVTASNARAKQLYEKAPDSKCLAWSPVPSRWVASTSIKRI